MSNPFRNTDSMTDDLSRHLASMSLSGSYREPELNHYGRVQLHSFGAAPPLPTSTQNIKAQPKKTECEPVWSSSGYQELKPAREEQRAPRVERSEPACTSRANPFFYNSPPVHVTPAAKETDTVLPPFPKRNRSTWFKQRERMATMPADSKIAEPASPTTTQPKAQQAGETSTTKPPPQEAAQTLLETYNPRKSQVFKNVKLPPPPEVNACPVPTPDTAVDQTKLEAEPTRKISQGREVRELPTTSTPSAGVIAYRTAWEVEFRRMIKEGLKEDVAATRADEQMHRMRMEQECRNARKLARMLTRRKPLNPIPVCEIPTSTQPAAPRTMDSVDAETVPELAKESNTRRAKSPYPRQVKYLQEQSPEVNNRSFNELRAETEARKPQMSVHNSKEIRPARQQSMSVTTTWMEPMREAEASEHAPKNHTQPTSAAEATEEPEDFEDIRIEEQNELEPDDWEDVKGEDLDAWKVLKRKDWEGPVQLFP
ncbi:hypothetical protein BDV96DRAFT_573486 [Lophiotrema nucula]|uniref:Uncharacterized protein n=1 Tax=Lophiotrema nucula TaxID=690887 RepID=A0A6A5ZB93_9PLEO|nr:hypothetical protein BDV96DRAFT_573486 [Lophiotrema nucula]